MVRFCAFPILCLFLLAGCSNAPPRVIQVFSQVNRTYDPDTQKWAPHLSVFVQASSADGTRVFDRLHLIHDGRNLYFTLAREQWAASDRPGEFWVGANDLSFPEGDVPTGTWRALLVTRAGQKVESSFEVPPSPPFAPPASNGRVTVRLDPKSPGRYTVSGWPEDYLVWSRDARGMVISRARTVGPGFQVAPGARTFELYTYDKNRGEGLLAGPFDVQERAKPADR